MTASDNKTFNKTEDEFLSEWYDIYTGLQSDGMLVTKSLIGYDQTNTYSVYEYDFKPKNYNRTILITSGLHSYELSAIYGIAHLFKDLMTTPYKHVGFKYIRENVRIKIIPILNPWGFNQSPKVYANSNGVNPNRNFNFEGSWEAYPNQPGNEWNYKGTSAFSEQETKNIANWLYYNKEIADFWIDFHTGYNDSSHDIWCLYQSYSPLASKIETAREKLVNRIKSKYSATNVNNYAQIDYANSIKIEWSEKAVGIPMMVVEQSPLNPKWKTGNYNNNGGAIREYATQAYVFLQELLSCDTVTYNLIDYLYTLRDDIFNNSCKQIPFYSSSSYKAFYNAGSTSSGNGGSGGSSGGSSVLEEKTLKMNLGAVSSNDGSVSSSADRVFSDFIETTSFKITTNSTNFVFVCRCFDGSKNYLGTITTTFSSTGSYPLKSGTKYIVLLGKLNNGSTIDTSTITGSISTNSVKYLIKYDSTLTLDKNNSPGGEETTKTLTSISATYNQGSTVVYPSTSLNSLKSKLVVTATYDDGSTSTVTEYALSGTLTKGTSAITVTYKSLNATFNVTVSAEPSNPTLTCTQTAIASSGGTESASTTRISTDYISITNTTGSMKINYTGDYYYTVRLYNSSKTYLGAITPSDYPTASGWARGNATINSNSITSKVAYVRIIFKSLVSDTTTIDSISGTLQINDGQNYLLIM